MRRAARGRRKPPAPTDTPAAFAEDSDLSDDGRSGRAAVCGQGRGPRAGQRGPARDGLRCGAPARAEEGRAGEGEGKKASRRDAGEDGGRAAAAAPQGGAEGEEEGAAGGADAPGRTRVVGAGGGATVYTGGGGAAANTVAADGDGGGGAGLEGGGAGGGGGRGGGGRRGGRGGDGAGALGGVGRDAAPKLGAAAAANGGGLGAAGEGPGRRGVGPALQPRDGAGARPWAGRGCAVVARVAGGARAGREGGLGGEVGRAGEVGRGGARAEGGVCADPRGQARARAVCAVGAVRADAGAGGAEAEVEGGWDGAGRGGEEAEGEGGWGGAPVGVAGAGGLSGRVPGAGDAVWRARRGGERLPRAEPARASGELSFAADGEDCTYWGVAGGEGELSGGRGGGSGGGGEGARCGVGEEGDERGDGERGEAEGTEAGGIRARLFEGRDCRLLGGQPDRLEQGGDQDDRPRKPDDDEACDTLDAFMSVLERDVSDAPPPKRRRQRDRLDVDDCGVDDVLAGGADAAPAPSEGAENDVWEEENDSNPLQVHANGLLLPPVDHSKVLYPTIVKDSYHPLPRLGALAGDAARAALAEAGVSVSAVSSSRLHPPFHRFEDLALTLPKALLGVLLSMYDAPTPVQRAVIPSALAGADLISVAKTGSGKTVAFALPLLAHVVAQDRRNAGVAGAGPSALVLAPTRELALQIAQVLRSFATSVGLGVACVVGGASKYQQFKQLRDGRNSVIVLTPGRFIDMVRMKACALTSVSFVVLDEADRMVESMGFGPQVNTVLSQIRPDAQKLLLSATFPLSIGHLARQYLSKDHVRLIVDRGGQATGPSAATGPTSTPVALVSENVAEHYIRVETESGRFSWLTEHLQDILKDGLAIVFCSTRGGTAALANQLRARGFAAGCLHGETDMADRAGVMRLFRSKELQLLVATDVAARGLDVDGVRTVVNYEPAKSYEDHVHRSGRTGRAGTTGKAFTLLVAGAPRDSVFVHAAVATMRAVNAPVPQTLLLALGHCVRPNRGRGHGRGRGQQGGRGHRQGLRG